MSRQVLAFTMLQTKKLYLAKESQSCKTTHCIFFCISVWLPRKLTFGCALTQLWTWRKSAMLVGVWVSQQWGRKTQWGREWGAVGRCLGLLRVMVCLPALSLMARLYYSTCQGLDLLYAAHSSVNFQGTGNFTMCLKGKTADCSLILNFLWTNCFKTDSTFSTWNEKRCWGQ